jgi:translation initiation factor 4A
MTEKNTTEKAAQDPTLVGKEEEGQFIESNWKEEIQAFDDLNLKEDLIRGIYGYGYENPSII